MHQLNERSFEWVKEMRAAGVLMDAQKTSNEYTIHKSRDCVTITYWCPDCDHIADKMDFHRKDLGQSPHPLAACNGGAIALLPDSPLNKFGDWPLQIFLENAKQAGKLKSCKTASLGSHLTCGAASAANLTPSQQLELLLIAREDVDFKLRLSEQIWQVEPHFHVYYGKFKENGRERKTYLVSRNNWIANARSKYMEEIDQLNCRTLDELMPAIPTPVATMTHYVRS